MVLPYLEATDDKLKELQAELGKTGANMSTADIKTLHDMEEQIRPTQKSIMGLKDAIVLYFQEPIKDALTSDPRLYRIH